jgi:predicted Zn-dependent protease
MLIAIYQNEKRPEEALALLQNLIARYPGSYLLKLETASTLVQLRRSDEAYKIFDDLLKGASTALAFDLIHYQYGEALATNNEHERAAEQFLLASRAANAEPGLATMALLRAGQVYDLAGKRNEALAQYKAVLARPNVYDTREQAERGIKQPFRDKEKEKKTEN